MTASSGPQDPAPLPADRLAGIGARSFPWKGWLLLLALIAFAIFRSSLGTRLDSFTLDEPYHIVAGTSYVRTGDFGLNPEHPPLMKLWLGASMPQSFKLRPFRALNEKIEERDFTEETVFYDNDAAAAQARTRASMWAFHGLLLLVLGLLIWRAAGLAWAAGALGWIALDPTLMAHAPVAMTDLPLTLALGIAGAATALVISTWRWRWVAVMGVGIGLALGAKHSALAGLLGVAAAGFIGAFASSWKTEVRVTLARLGKVCVAGVIGWMFLWLLYGAHFHASRDGTDGFNVPMSQKVGGLGSGAKAVITLADRWHLLPRPYLWGLADTIRTGVEGRENQHLFYGKWLTGHPPVYFWPGLAVSKIPLGLLAFSLLGLILLWRGPISREMKALLFCIGAVGAGHFLALLSSDGTWGGIRHALPLYLPLAVLAGAAVSRAWQTKSAVLATACAACWLLTLGITIREPRLWEYGNSLVGGTAGAYRYFQNEGQDLGQRYREFKQLYDNVIKPSGKPVYTGSYWALIEEQTLADHIRFARFCPTLDDRNTGAIYDGYYMVSTSSLNPVPFEHWDPATEYRGLERVARLGNLVVLRGRWVTAKSRAFSLRDRALEAIYKNPHPDWNLIAAKLSEVEQAIPWSSATSILAGNVRLKTNEPAEALRAYERALSEMEASDFQHPRVERQIARLRAGESPATIEPLASVLLE